MNDSNKSIDITTFAMDGSSDISKFVEKLYHDKNGQSLASLIGIEMPDADTQSLDSVTDKQKELLRTYNSKLIEKGIGMSRAQLKKKDLMDLRDICKYQKSYLENPDSKIPVIDSNAITDEFLQENYWYDYIPCFNEGVMQINTARYIYWKMNEVDVINRKLDVFIRDYFRSNDVWQVGVSANLISIFPDIQTSRLKSDDSLEMDIKDYQLFSDIYRFISYDELHWTKPEIDIWEKFTIAYAENTEKRLLNKYNTNNAIELAKLFVHFVLLSNQELYFNKPKAVRNSSKSKTVKKQVVVESNNAPKQITRVVGRVTMKSIKVPKMPSAETVIHYKTAVWKARGGVRRMKNGKLVPFKESIRHRKCLMKDEEVPRTVLKFKSHE